MYFILLKVKCFNNYLRDPKRPQLPEHPGNSKQVRKDVNDAPQSYPPAANPYKLYFILLNLFTNFKFSMF